MRRLLATTAVITGLALVVPAIPATAAFASPTEEAPPNERAPKTPPEQDDALPWTTEAGRDMNGYRPSTYTGTYYLENREQYRLCVLQRESGGNYDESSGSHIGAYQFSYSLASQALTQMRPEIADTYGRVGLRALDSLAKKPMYTWPRFWQDAAFWTIFDKGRGWSHWSSQWGANWDCDHRPNAEEGWPSPSRYHYSPIKGDSQRAAETSSSKRSGRDDPRASRFGRSPHAFGTPAYSQWLAKKFIKAKHRWAGGHFKALKQMWWRESNWRYDVVNWQGPWYGLGQVNGTFIGQQGYSIAEYRRSPYVQIVVGAAYIKYRYGSPKAAWNFWQANGWY